MRRIWLGLLSLVVLGCPAKPDPPATGPATVTVTTASTAIADVPPPPSEQLPAWLVLQSHQWIAPQVQYLPVHIATWLGGAALETAPVLSTAAVEGPERYLGNNRRQSYEALAAHGDGQVVIRVPAAAAGTGKYALEVWSVPQGSRRTIALGERRPTALHVHRSTAYVGYGERVGYVPLTPSSRLVEVLRRKAAAGYKAYDLFARAGDWLVAIDDEVVPMYADSFRIAASGVPQHRAPWTLPDVINGTYELAALLPDGPAEDGKLLLVTRYSILSGHGHDLLALPIRKGELATVDRPINATAHDDPAVIEEHVDSHPSGDAFVAGGSAYSAWTGMAIVGNATQVALAAGHRGIMLFPLPFTRTTRAKLIDVGGFCHDVRRHGNHLLALVGGPPAVEELADKPGEPPQLVALEWTGKELRKLSSTKLPGAYERFVE